MIKKKKRKRHNKPLNIMTFKKYLKNLKVFMKNMALESLK